MASFQDFITNKFGNFKIKIEDSDLDIKKISKWTIPTIGAIVFAKIMSINFSHSGYERAYSFNLTNPSEDDSIYYAGQMDALRHFIKRSKRKYGRVYKKDHLELFGGEDTKTEYFTYYPSSGRKTLGNTMVWFWMKKRDIDMSTIDKDNKDWSPYNYDEDLF